MTSNDGWSEWSRYVLKELERLNSCFQAIDDKVGIIHTDITVLKVKLGMIGFIGGAIGGAVISVLVGIIFKK